MFQCEYRLRSVAVELYLSLYKTTKKLRIPMRLFPVENIFILSMNRNIRMRLFCKFSKVKILFE